MNQTKRKYDILCVGELLVDCISTEFAKSMEEVKSFDRFLGGSPANLSLNMTKLGNESKLIACVGNDSNGDFILQQLQDSKIDCSHIKRSRLPSTIILITRSAGTSQFEAYRGADTQISEDQLHLDLLKASKIFHTTCFAISKKPSQYFILKAAKEAYTFDCQLSIDLNYAQEIWDDRAAAQKIVADYCAMGALVKMSDVDWKRLYETSVKSPEAVTQHFLDLGAKEVCLTLGEDGCFASDGESNYFLETREIKVKDTTGAGDAFWSGYLTAWLDGLNLKEKLMTGRKMAELKLSHIGAIPTNSINKENIYADF